MQKDGQWQPWQDAYCLDLIFHVRNSLVYVSYRIEGKAVQPSADYWNPVDEDCTDNDAVGLFWHPESSDPIRIPHAGCARAWIEVGLGKWLYPRLRDGAVNLLDQRAADLARQVFEGDFVEACEWG